MVSVCECMSVYGNKTPTMGQKPNKTALSPGKIDIQQTWDFEKSTQQYVKCRRGFFSLCVSFKWIP